MRFNNSLRSAIGVLLVFTTSLPLSAAASVVIVANNSDLSAYTYAEVGGQNPATDTDSQGTDFATDTSVPATFGDTISARAEATGYGPPTLQVGVSASASLDSMVSESGGVVTITADGGASAEVYPNILGSGEASAAADLALVLQLDMTYAYSFSSGPIGVGAGLNGFGLVSAQFGGEGATLFKADSLATDGCEFGCSALTPFDGSFEGVLSPGTYAFGISAQALGVDAFDYADIGEGSFTGSSLVLTPIAATVPIPGAVWLFGTAWGLLCWMQRRTA